MNSIKLFLFRTLQESQPPSPGEWGLIITLLTLLGSTLNLLFSNRNTLVRQQQEIIDSQQREIEKLKASEQEMRNNFANAERRRIALEGDVQVLKDKYQRERLKVKSLKKKLTQRQTRTLRGGKNNQGL